MINQFVFTYPKDQNGENIKYMFMVSFRKRLSEIKTTLERAVASTQGIDNFAQAGQYTVEISISRAYDADEVIAELTEKLKDVTSDLVVATAQQVNKLKLV